MVISLKNKSLKKHLLMCIMNHNQFLTKLKNNPLFRLINYILIETTLLLVTSIIIENSINQLKMAFQA